MTKDEIIKSLNSISEVEHSEFLKGYSESVSQQIEKVYIDLTYLQDIYLGSILYLTKDKEVYQYILNNIDAYIKRCTDDHVSYFPDLNLKEEDLINYIKDKDNTKTLLLTSPPTLMCYHLPDIHRNNLLENRYKIGIKETIKTITYIVNTYPLVLDKEDMLFLKKKFISMVKDSNINFGIISKPSNSLSLDTYKNINMWFLSDLESWSDENCNGYKALYRKLLLNTAIMYIEPRITNKELLLKLHELTEDDLRAIELNTILSLNVFSEIKYLRSGLMILEDNNEDK